MNCSCSALLNKNTQLRESLARVRLSRESFKSRLKNSHSIHKSMEGNQRRMKVQLNFICNLLLSQIISFLYRIHGVT